MPADRDFDFSDEQGKQFFFEKKNQKTFADKHSRWTGLVSHHTLAIKFVSDPKPPTTSAICDVSAAGEVSNCSLQSTNGGAVFGP